MLRKFALRLCRTLGLTMDISIVLGSRSLLLFTSRDPDHVVEFPLADIPTRPEPVHASLPQNIREDLTTRLHTGEVSRYTPVLMRGEFHDFETAQYDFNKAIRILLGKRLIVKPRILCTQPWESSNKVRTKVLLDLLERCGALRVYTASTGIVTAVGLQLDMEDNDVHAVLLVESDWAVFTVVSHYVELCYRFIPIGSDDLQSIVASDTYAELLLEHVKSGLHELRDSQIAKLVETGVICIGLAEKIGNRLCTEISVPCHHVDTDLSPTAAGLKHYRIDDFKATKDSKRETL